MLQIRASFEDGKMRIVLEGTQNIFDDLTITRALELNPQQFVLTNNVHLKILG